MYKVSNIDGGEAIVFSYSQHVELDGQLGLSVGKPALVEKKKGKYRARDFTERGSNDKLGLPTEGRAACSVGRRSSSRALAYGEQSKEDYGVPH